MLTILLKLIGALVGVANRFSDNALARAQVQAGVDIAGLQAGVELARTQRDVITSGMQFRVFWVAWALAALPMAAWFGWGMLDTLTNGALPDVASIPLGLKPYADTVWQNIFYTGAAGAIAQGTTSTIAKVLSAKR
jgi:hypothetical protein